MHVLVVYCLLEFPQIAERCHYIYNPELETLPICSILMAKIILQVELVENQLSPAIPVAQENRQ